MSASGFVWHLSAPLDEAQTADLYGVGALHADRVKSPTLGDSAVYAGVGGRIWRFIKNGEASTAMAVGDVVVQSFTTLVNYVGTILGSGSSAVSWRKVLGVAQAALAAGSWGWVLAVGVGLVKVETAQVTGDYLTATNTAYAGGCVASSSAPANTAALLIHFGVAIETDATLTTAKLCRVNVL